MAKEIPWKILSEAYAFIGNSLLKPMTMTSTVGLDPAFWEAFPSFDDEAVAEDEMVQAMRATAEIAVPMPNIPEMDVMWTVVSDLLTDVNLSGRDVQESFDAALAQAQNLIANMR